MCHLPVPQQPHRIQYHQDAAELVGDGAADHVHVAAAGEPDHCDVVHQRKPQTLLDDPQRLPAEADAEGDFREIIRHQRHVRGFVRDIGAGHPHRHADIGHRQGRRVVDAVANHRDATVFFERFNVLRLLLRQDFGLDFVNPQLPGNVEGNPAVVARQHDDLGNAELPELLHGGAGISPHRIGNGDTAAELAVVRHQDVVVIAGHCDGVFGEQGRIANDQFLAGVFGNDAPLVRCERSRVGRGAASFAEDGAGNRVRAHFFCNRRQADEFGGGVVAVAADVRNFRLAVGEGAGFVENNGMEPGGGFEVLTAFDEDAGAGGAGDPGHDGGGGGQNQRARTGDDQHGDRAFDVAGEQIDECGEAEHDRHEPAGEPVESALDGRFTLLGGFDELGDAGEGGVVADTPGFDDQRAGFVEGADEDFVAGFLVDRHTLAGNRRLVDGGGTAANDAVHGDPFTGADDDDVTDLEVGCGNFCFLVSAPDTSQGRDEGEEAAEGATGAAGGVGFELFAELHDEGDFAGGDEFANRRSSDDGNGDEDIRVETFGEEGFAGAVDDGETGQDGGGNRQRRQIEQPAGQQQRADAGGAEEGELGGAGFFGSAVAGGEVGGVAGSLDGGNEVSFRAAGNGGGFVEEVDGDRLDTGDGGERLLGGARTARAVHAVDLERDGFHDDAESVVAGGLVVEGLTFWMVKQRIPGAWFQSTTSKFSTPRGWWSRRWAPL
ncbi:MAG: hypothetical protein PCFJNLEI_00186 [Verrucomicrobiae bacterium]|nr:hypothetical protein [Verrucomicrobiae bacterium]